MIRCTLSSIPEGTELIDRDKLVTELSQLTDKEKEKSKYYMVLATDKSISNLRVYPSWIVDGKIAYVKEGWYGEPIKINNDNELILFTKAILRSVGNM